MVSLPDQFAPEMAQSKAAAGGRGGMGVAEILTAQHIQGAANLGYDCYSSRLSARPRSLCAAYHTIVIQLHAVLLC